MQPGKFWKHYQDLMWLSSQFGKNELNNKQLSKEISDLKTKYDGKCSEIKAVKDAIEVAKKDTNNNSAALKTEIIKSHENKVKKLEIKILELVEFRNKKLSEEKEVRLKQRKELRRSLKKKVDNENSKEYNISNITERVRKISMSMFPSRTHSMLLIVKIQRQHLKR